MKFDISQISSFLIAILILFMVYRRFRRNFGQQPLRPVRMQIRIGLLTLIGCLLVPNALRSAAFLAAMLGGLAAGIALAAWGGARTRFLRDSKQLYYVPHTYTGVAVSFLFLGRLIYRLLQVYAGSHPAQAAGATAGNQGALSASMVSSPLTLGLFFVLMGYYVCYYSIVLFKSKRVVADEVSPVSAA